VTWTAQDLKDAIIAAAMRPAAQEGYLDKVAIGAVLKAATETIRLP
jgi:hypothetical protein